VPGATRLPHPITAGRIGGSFRTTSVGDLVSDPTAMTAAPGVEQPHTSSSWVHVAEMKDLARRKRTQVTVAGRPIALFLVDDEVFAIDDICIHQERSLSKGTLLNGQVICPGHQWKFDPRTGRPEDQDGCQATYAVQVTEEGAILVAPEPVTPRQATSNSSSTHPADAEAR
jgi:nitrite reductase/ring-hydroxylating ferredoxin subunit